MIDNSRWTPKARISREYTAVTSVDRKQLSSENRAARVEDAINYREDLAQQVLERKSPEELIGHSTFSPIESADGVLRSRLYQVNDIHGKFVGKVTETDKNASLYARQTSESIPIGNRLGYEKQVGKIIKFTEKEVQTKMTHNDERRRALDELQNERNHMQEKLQQDDKKLTKMHMAHQRYWDRGETHTSGNIKSFTVSS